jgi:LysM repeat protein
MFKFTSTLFFVVAVSAPALAQPPNESADTVVYRAKRNDTYGFIASEYYGDRNKAAFIITENKIQTPRPLQGYERLRIPIIREITTSPNDTFQSIAGAYLGDPRRGAFLADANGMSPDDNLAAGTPVLVPFTVTHTADAKESLAGIAATYYGDAKLAEALRAYNFLDKNTLDKGEAITVPSMNVKVHPKHIPPPDAEAKARRERRRENSKLAATAIPAARHAWRIGDYNTVKKTLSAIDVEYVELLPAIEVGILLGSALVAFGDTDGASTAFRHVLDRKPSHTLRKVDHSPKILAVWTKAEGQVE